MTAILEKLLPMRIMFLRSTSSGCIITRIIVKEVIRENKQDLIELISTCFCKYTIYDIFK